MATDMIEIDESAQGGQLQMAVGEMLEVQLEENPTAGFRWQLISEGQPACTLVVDEFEPGDETPGAGGHHTWQFEAVQAGDARIELAYRRQWMPETPAARVVIFSVHVEA